MRFFNVVAVLCLFAVIGCAEFKDEKKEDQDLANMRVSAQNLSDFVKIGVQPTTEPEKYMVYFGWPKITDPRRVRIRMEQTLAVVESNQTTFSHEVGHNQTLTYTFDILSSDNKIEKSFSKLVKIPRDYVVRKDQSEFLENTTLSVNRIFFDDVPLKTNGFNIEIQANELIANKGIIETFPEGVKANLNADGRSGGNLILNANSAHGSLKVYMRGEHGGDGGKGPAFPSRASDGVGAGEGSLFCDCIGRNCMGPISTEPQIQGRACSCESMGRDAGNGSNGAKGNKGLSARNGGSSGNLKINIKDGAGFLIETFKAFGVAGVPGEGGDGQPGGYGGAKAGGKCSGKAGGGGATGPKGDGGDKADDGKLGTICVYIASEGKNDCY